MLKMRATATIALITMACFGCAERELAPLTPHVSRIFSTQVGGEGVADVDLLFVIDNSGSMESEQASLRREIPRLIETLTNPPLNERGEPIHPAVESLQIAADDLDGFFGHGGTFGDVDGDGYPDLVVGGARQRVDTVTAGAIYVYSGRVSGLQDTPNMTRAAPEPERVGWFGGAIGG